MALWLFKEEPTHFSFADLVAAGSATWDGVSNALALKHLRSCQPGDRVFYYHTGKEKAIVGMMEVTKGYDPQTDAVQVVVEPIKALKRPVTLAEIKADSVFAGWELVRISRLSVMPVSQDIWKRIEQLAKSPTES